MGGLCRFGIKAKAGRCLALPWGLCVLLSSHGCLMFDVWEGACDARRWHVKEARKKERKVAFHTTLRRA